MNENESNISPEDAEELPVPEEYSDDSAEDVGDDAATAPRRRRPWWQKTLIGLGWTIVGLVVLGFLFYEFGGMANSANDPTMHQQYVALVGAGKIAPISKNRGRLITLDHTTQALVTVHPSYLLRLPDEEAKAREYARFVADLRLAAKLLGSSAHAA